MTAPQDIPGYTQGFIFSDENSRYYNGADTFFDQGPYASWGLQDCTLFNGIPAFDTTDGHRGLILNNASHWEFLASALWEGSHMIVGKFIPTVDTSTRRTSLINMGGASNYQIAAGDELWRTSGGEHRIYGKPQAAGGAGVLAVKPDDRMRAVVFTASQKMIRWTSAENTTITSYPSLSPFGRGEGIAPSSYNGSSFVKAVIGQTRGDPASLVPYPECGFIIYELHYWSTPIIEDYPATTLACLASKNAEYGIA